MLDGIADAGDHLEPRAHAQLLRCDVLHQRQPVHELHREVRLRVAVALVCAGLVDLRNAGVAKAPEHLGLLPEPRQQGAGDESRPDDLERHGAARVLLLRLVDAAHPAFADLAEDAVGADRFRRGIGVGEPVVDTRR
jgi:hypothetical protein